MKSMFAPFGASGTPTFWAVQRRNAITTSDARMNFRRENNNLDERIGKLLLEREVEDFIAREAAMLDEWRLDEWLGLFTDDGR